MGENQNHLSSSRLRNAAAFAGGEIVEVRGGGHIVRSTGRKDRHSKVCTAKGPRDRRVRLAAHTAIQFYDVQDRLGYDRPSKAVDWLINKAKSAIDELAQLPAWKPIQNPNFRPEIQAGDSDFLNAVAGPPCKRATVTVGNENQSFLPTSMDSDTIKSFFPIGGASPEPNSSALQFHSQDLRLSLQSFQDPTILLHHHHQNPPPPSHGEPQDLFSCAAATQLVFNASVHHEHHHRLPAWNSGIDSAAAAAGGGGGGERVSSGTEGYLFNSLPPVPVPLSPQTAAPELYEQVYGGQSEYLCSQRGPLQSINNTPWIRAWTEPSPATAITAAAADPTQHQTTTMLPFYPSPLSTIGGGFSGFRIPARIQGEEEEHDGFSDKLSSASSDSCH